MNNTTRCILSVIAATVIYPLAAVIIAAAATIMLTVGIIGLTAFWLYKGSKH
jgi:hypothetical protein